MPLFSIIIPVYNSQEYLRSCLESIRCQKMGDYEVILVDDGSSDSSLAVCREYHEMDPRFIVITQANAGTSAARNTGIRHASGHYLTFIDNDDFWMNDDALTSLEATARETDADLIIHESIIYDSKSGNYDSPIQPDDFAASIAAADKATALSLLIEKELLCSAVWTKACKRSVVLENELLFPGGMRNEDTYWTGRAILYVRSIAWCDNVFYAYRKSHEYAQTSHPIKLSHIRDLCDICSRVSDEARDAVSNPAELEACLSFLAYPYAVLLGQSALVPTKTLKESSLHQQIISLRWLLNYSRNPNVRKARLLSKSLGLETTRKVLGFALKKRHPGIEVDCGS